MKKIIFALLALIPFVQSFGQSDDTTQYTYYRYSYGTRSDRIWTNKVLRAPLDTIYSKSGLAILAGTLYVGNGARWNQVTGGGGSSFDSLTTQGGVFHTGNFNDARYRQILDTAYAHLLMTRAWGYKIVDSLGANKMTNFGGAPGQLQGAFTAIPAATSYNTGTTYIAQDSGFLYVDTGSGGTRGWKLISSIPQTFNLYLKQGLKPFHNSTDTAAFGGSFTEDDTLDLGYHNLLWLHVQNEATPGSTDSLFIKLNNGKMMVVPAAAFVENNGASTGIKAGTFATRPTASNCQCYYWSTDSLFWSYDNGSWKDLKAGGITVTNTAGTGPATTASGNVLNVDTMRWAHIYNVKDFGAVGDGKRITDGAITSASHTFTSAMAGFTAADVGKIIRVPGAGSSGHDMLTTISAFTNSTTVTLTSAAATTVSSDTVMYGTDNTSFFQAAIFADSLNLGGKVYVPNGVYLFGGPLITSAFGGNPNSQLYFPVAPQGGPGFNRRTHYVIEGETPPNYQPAGFADSLVMLTGTVLYSMIDGSGNLPALFGTASSNAFFNSINYNNFTFRNLTIMVAQNIGNGGPSMGGINGYFMASLVTDNVGVYADGSIARSVKPTNEVAGICYSQKESEIQSVCSNTQVVGFKYGMIFFDGALINNGFAFICQHAFVFPSNAENIQANYLKAFWNINNIYFPNSTICGIIPSGTAYVNITNMQSEVFNAGVWYQYSFIVIDSGNNGHGNIGYTISQAGGTFNNGLYNVFGGSNILSQAIGSPAGTPGLDNVLATNNSSSHTIVLTGEQPNAPSFSAAFETLQPLSALNIMWGDNVLGTGGGSLMKYDTTGQAAWIQLVQGDILGRVAVSGSAGSSITPLNAFSFNLDKSGFIGGNGAAQGSTNGWLNWNTTGQFGVNTAYNSGAAMTLPASTTSVASMLINEGTPPTTTTDRIYAKSSDHNLYWAGSCVSCGATSPVIFSQTASGSAIASGTAATIFGTGTGSLTIAGGTLQVGQKITLHGYVQVSTAGSSPGGLTFSPVIGATGYSFATTPTTSLSNAVYEIELTYTVLTTGTSGTCFSVIKVIPNNAVPQMAQSGTLTINTTTSLTLDITGLWGTWVSGDTMNSLPSFTVEVK